MENSNIQVLSTDLILYLFFMDSLSQIVLGAAVGEAILGKKIGNKAMVLGAIGGTIPDLDVIPGSLFMTPIEAMDFHRGISHSFLFSAVAPLLVGGVAFLFYKKGIHENKWYRAIVGGLPLLCILFLGGIATYAAVQESSTSGIIGSALVALLFIIPLFLYIKNKPKVIETPSFMNWYWFFFGTFVTHILLDALTTYGTQLFLPFSNMRVELGSISIVDPLYTLPFLFFLLLAACMRRKSSARKITNNIGIVLSSAYLLWGIYAKTGMNQVVRNSLAKQQIEYKKYATTPTLFNTFLWSATVETDSSILVGAYSRFDPKPEIKKFTKFPKNQHLIAGHENDPHIQTLRRFHNDYYVLKPTADSSTIQIIGLKWGGIKNLIKNSKEDFPPGMTQLIQLRNNQYELVEEKKEEDGGVFENLTTLPKVLQNLQEEYPTMFQDFWDRINGKWQ